MEINCLELIIEVKGKNSKKFRRVKEYEKDNITYIEGRKGSTFRLKFNNNRGRRLLLVPSIDGLSIITGKPAGFNSDGYIIDGDSSITIPGWLLNSSTAGSFYFSDSKDSYSGRLGNNTNNNGVIGLYIFEEYYEPIKYIYKGTAPIERIGRPWGSIHPTKYINNDTITCGASTIISDNNFHNELGTGIGPQRDFRVQNGDFQKDTSHYDLIEIYYKSNKQLENMGIFPPKKIVKRTPKAFPLDFNKYCKPPIGYHI